MTNSVAVGGMEEHVRLLAEKIDRSRFVVDAAAPDWEPTAEWNTALAEAADHFSTRTPDRRHGIAGLVRETFGLWRHARRQRFDVAHLHGTSYHGLTYAIVALRLAGVRRLFLTEHLPPEEPQSARTRRLRRATTRLLAGLVCVSDFNRDARLRYLGDPGCAVHVVNNGIDVDRFDEAADPAVLDRVRDEHDIAHDALIVATAIRLEPGKGVDDLIRGFAEVAPKHPTAVLLVAGDGSLRAELEMLAAELGVADRCRFVGFRSDPQPYIRLADAFVLPVPYGSASIGLLEAMAMGRACIITFGSGGEAVVHDECGYCARPNDPASIAEHVHLLLADADTRNEFGRRARARVEADYSAERVARQLEAIYLDEERAPAT